MIVAATLAILDTSYVVCWDFNDSGLALFYFGQGFGDLGSGCSDLDRILFMLDREFSVFGSEFCYSGSAVYDFV